MRTHRECAGDEQQEQQDVEDFATAAPLQPGLEAGPVGGACQRVAGSRARQQDEPARSRILAYQARGRAGPRAASRIERPPTVSHLVVAWCGK